jgi:hypothetical protein
MSDTLSFTKLDGQQVELLPPRTVMSLFNAGGRAGTPGSGGEGDPGSGHNGNHSSNDNQVNIQSEGVPGPDGSANPGH